MKRVILITTVVTVALLVVGCGGSAQPTQSSTPARDISTPSKALLGHWQDVADNGSVYDYYYSPTTQIGVSQGGTPITLEYSIVSEDAKAHQLVMKTGNTTATITFNEDASKLEWRQTGGSSSLSSTYVDAQQSP